jgi:hypothetical protein
MAVEPEPPHVAALEQLARGEEPAAGAPVAPGIPGRGAGHLVGRLLLYAVLLAIAVIAADEVSDGK